MSFDSDFDFVDISKKLVLLSETYNVSKNEIIALVSRCSSWLNFDVLKSERLSSLNKNKTDISSKIISIIKCEDNVTGVMTLSSEDKNKLFLFYKLWALDIDKRHFFMTIIMNNYASMLLDSEINKLILDTINPLDCKHVIAGMLIAKYPPCTVV